MLCHPELRPSAKANQTCHLAQCQTITGKAFRHGCCSNHFRVLNLESCLMSPSINVYYRQPIKSNTVFHWVPPNKYYSQILLVIQKLHMWGVMLGYMSQKPRCLREITWLMRENQSSWHVVTDHGERRRENMCWVTTKSPSFLCFST